MTKELAEICSTLSKVLLRNHIKENFKLKSKDVWREEESGLWGGRQEMAWLLLGNQGRGRKTQHRFCSKRHMIWARTLSHAPAPVEKLITACFSFQSLFPPNCCPADGLSWQQQWNLQKRGWRTGAVHWPRRGKWLPTYFSLAALRWREKIRQL